MKTDLKSQTYSYLKDGKIKSIKEQEFVFGIGPQRCPSREITPMIYKNIVYQILVKFKLQVVKPKLKVENYSI